MSLSSILILIILQNSAISNTKEDDPIYRTNANNESIDPHLLIRITTEKLTGDLSLENKFKLNKIQAIALDRAGLYEKAIVAFKKALSIRPDDLETNFGLGFCYNIKANKTDEAKPIFDMLVDKNPTNQMVYIGMSQYAMRSNQLEMAAKEIEKARKIDPESVWATLAQADLGKVSKGEQRNAAIQLISKSILAWNDDHALQPYVLADYFKNRGKLYYLEGNYSKAITDFRLANSLGVDEHNKLVSQASIIFCHFRLGNKDSAKILLDDLLAKFGKIPVEHVSYDFLMQFHYIELALSNKHDELLKRIADLISADSPGVREFHIAIQFYIYLGKHDAANYLCANYENRTGISMPSIRMLHAYLPSSSPNVKVRDAKLALLLTASYEEEYDNNPKYLMVRALALAENSQFKEAISIMEKAIAKLPHGAPAKAAYQKKLDVFKDGKPYRLNPDSLDLDIIDVQ